MSLRERIVRKAKDKAVENLLITYSPSKNSSPSNVNKSKRANRSTYKAFGEQTNISDEENSDENTETPTKKVTRTRRKAITAKEKPLGQKSRQHLTFNKTIANVDTIDTLASDNSLFSQILSGQVSLQSIVDDWIDSYKKSKEKAMLDLIQFLVRSSGCKAAHMINNKEILKTKEFTEIINDLIENFNGDENNNTNALPNSAADAYPFIQTSFQAKRFKSNFCEFILLLVNQCQYSIIYDQFMTDILITFLIALADSQVRAFRHTATLAVLKIMTGLVDVLLALSVAKDACQRQYDNERAKSTVKRAQDRIEMLTNKRKELEENEYEVQNYINFIFKAVAIHRYRDVCDAIRCVCINEIGEWMRRYPNKFLDDTFLKYIGWTLHDKVAECRLKCLQALQPLYEEEALLPKLELFTSRFKNRIIEMSLDKDYDVSVSAIKLLTSIINNNDAALEDKDCENLYELVYHTNRQVAHAAGEFLNQKLFIKNENPPVEFKRGKKLSENSTFIQLLVQFLIESELHDHPAYLIDSMWDIHPMLKDWECMTDLLLEDPLNQEDVMDDTHERYLVEIITCCVRQAATGEYPIARRATANRKLTIKETKQVQDDRTLLTQHFITTLPLLLTKYIADQEKLVYLLQIPSYFDLNQYTARRQEKSLDDLLKIIQEIVSKHNDSEVLAECSRCLCYLCDEDNSIYIKCNLARSTILDDLVNTFNKAMDKMTDQNEVDENEFFPLVIALRRLSAFAENHTIVNYDIVGHTLTILKWAIFNEDMGADLACKAMNLARSVLTWHLHKLNVEMDERLNAGDDAPEVNYELIDIIAKLTRKFYKICNKLFIHDNPQIEEEAYFEICDLLILFNVHLVNYRKEYKNLILECSTNDINMLSVYVMNNVFTENAITEKPDSSERIEKLHKRRCILSSFCKLICYNCVPIKYAAEILRGYIRFAGSYGDIIKQLLSSCREISKVNTAKTMALALQREYIEVQININSEITISDDTNNQTRIDRSQPEFIALKELTRRFCLTFGPDASTKSREAIVAIHQEAIRYVNELQGAQTGTRAPPNLLFLEVIMEFSSRLIPQDKKLIQAELDRCFAKRANKIESNNWLPYYTYRISLMDDPSSAQAALNSDQQANMNQTKKAANNETIRQSDSTIMPAPLNPELHSTKNYQRKRKQNHAIDISGVAMLKDTSRLQVNKNLDVEDLDEENENVDKETNDYNQHAETTTNDFEALKLSTINHNEPDNYTTRSGRLTRSSKLFSAPQKIVSGNNKRPRSPLATNNSINESTDQTNILCSTRIETKSSKLIHKPPKKPVISSISQRAIMSNFNELNKQTNLAVSGGGGDNSVDDDEDDQDKNNVSDIDQNDETISDLPSPKRNRRSDENEVNDDGENLLNNNSNTVLSVS